MAVRHVLIAVLGMVPPSGCVRDCGEPPMTEHFYLEEEPVTAEQLETIWAEYPNPGLEQLRCEAACEAAYTAHRGWLMDGSPSECSLTVYEPPESGGEVTCIARGIQYEYDDPCD